MATYIAYLYLNRNDQKESDIWIDVSEILVKEINTRHTTLDDFEKMYVNVGVDNYAWYQAVFLLQVKELYQEQGLQFLFNYKNYQWSSISTSQYLNEMDEIGSGFDIWAQKFNLQK